MNADGNVNVLSLFDGISCGQAALERAGVRYDRYYASEIDKHAMAVAKARYPATEHIGDVTEVCGYTLPPIHLLMGGSPCQGFSNAGKRRGFDDPRSALFWHYVRVLEEAGPRFFLLENVPMDKRSQDVISDVLGVQPVELNSALTSAQNRVRLYWANFPIEAPEDAGIKLADVLDSGSEGWRKASIIGRRLNAAGHREDYNKSVPITQCLEVRATNTDKSNCLTTVAKDTVLTPLPVGRHADVYGRRLPYRDYTKAERCRLMGLPGDYCDLLSYHKAVKATGNGWEAGMIAHILKQMPI